MQRQIPPEPIGGFRGYLTLDLFRRGLREFGLPGTLFTPVRTKAHNPEYEKYIGMEGTERDERERKL